MNHSSKSNAVHQLHGNNFWYGAGIVPAVTVYTPSLHWVRSDLLEDEVGNQSQQNTFHNSPNGGPRASTWFTSLFQYNRSMTTLRVQFWARRWFRMEILHDPFSWAQLIVTKVNDDQIGTQKPCLLLWYASPNRLLHIETSKWRVRPTLLCLSIAIIPDFLYFCSTNSLDQSQGSQQPLEL